MNLKLSIKYELDNLYALYISFFFFLILSWIYSPVNTMKVMSSQSVYLTTPLLDRLSPLSGSPVFVHIVLPKELPIQYNYQFSLSPLSGSPVFVQILSQEKIPIQFIQNY